MISYLKESTFAVNEVIGKAWTVTKSHYLSLATLCFLMFITSMTSTVLALFFSEIDFLLSIFMVFIFVVMYFALNLTLFKYIFHLLDDEANDVTILSTLPTKVQLLKFLAATVLFVLFILLILFIVTGIPFTVFYLLLKMKMFSVSQREFDTVANIFVLLGVASIFIGAIRLSFFPFFVLDKGSSPFASLKFSLAITKGNFSKLVLLLLVLGIAYFLYIFLNSLGWTKMAFFLNILSSFIIVPLSSVSLTVAYRKMMTEYKGDEDPSILDNIV